MAAPVVFKESWFAFEEGEKVIEHVDDYPKRGERDLDLYHIEGHIPSDGDFVWLAINIQDPEVAGRMLQAARARLKAEIEEAGGLRTDMVSNAALVGPGNEGSYDSMYGRADQDPVLA
jgi:hypothetical protein